ncbi:MAG: SidA/IucD/PvdA family monooxygenase [Candidatus Rokubacteria bacterium]|nr:SidA/IucD/PvdA family monooxygenase [Candidatus Rokubacteria bacterium]
MPGPGLAVAIVGAGIHAAVVAVRLLHEWPSLRRSLRLIDPSGACLGDWRRRTWGQGMETMRSPGAHHLDVAPESLLEYARARGRANELAAPYHRPSLQLFMDHSRWVVERHGLEELIVPTRVVAVEPTENGYRLHGADTTTLETRVLILAPGLRGQEREPAWADDLRHRAPTLTGHVESLDVRTEAIVGERVLVVGGGLSAATLAEAAAERGARVTLLSRHRLEARLFDADPGWVGPKYLSLYQREPNLAARLRMIARARGRGSITPELLARLRQRQRNGGIEILEDSEIHAVQYDEPRRTLGIGFGPPARQERFRRVWWCTGFAPSVERLPWLGPLARVPQYGGRPVVGPTLELARGCFATGWLAELWIGPAARNISGARHAARVIADTLRGRRGELDGRVSDAA